ncbi:MAG: substrate-binding domain-containing protein [Lachnospiraceae bacterium]|nr:substrate-binding domain-containing protein [Lachnospiraceae bacterium]
MEKKIRMADLAEQLGISVVSVSKALSGKEGVSDEVREKVLALAKQMNYVPLRNRAPKEEKASVSGNIGILVADRYFADNAFYTNLYRQIQKKCNSKGFSALLEIISWESEHQGVLPAMLQGKKADGIIFMGELKREYLTKVMQCGLPYMLLDFYDEELDADGVTSDNLTGGYRLANHLIQKGKKSIGFIGSIHATSSIMDRYLGYTKAMLNARLAMEPKWILEDRDRDGSFIEPELPEELPEAFLCSCDEVAYNLVEQLKKRGLRVPEDVAVVGYDDYYFAQICNPPLTTYRVNVEEMGTTVANQMIYRITGKHIVHGNLVAKGNFVKRQST